MQVVEPVVARPSVKAGRDMRVHLVGVCGAGMKALAEYLTDVGCRVTGSDSAAVATPPILAQRGLRVHAGHSRLLIDSQVDLVVHSPAVGPENPELQQARSRGILCRSYHEMLADLLADKIGIAVAGTHGKSSTTAMLAWILRQDASGAGAIIGAEIVGLGVNAWAGQGDLLVVESCEYRRHFLSLVPRYAAILGVEPDHFDCFSDDDALHQAFCDFAARVRSDGVLLLPAVDPLSARLAEVTEASVVQFAVGTRADWWAADLRPDNRGTRFRLFHGDRFVTEVRLPLPGTHNVANAVAAAALAAETGATAATIREGLETFPGLRRRFERVGSWRGVTLVDDYAHHPTAVRATLQAARQVFGNRRLLCVFQPHQVSRTEALFEDFVRSFAEADRVLLCPVFAAREPETIDRESVVRRLATDLERTGRSAMFIPSLDRMLATLDYEARPGDVLITLGAGNIDRVHNELHRRLQRNHSA